MTPVLSASSLDQSVLARPAQRNNLIWHILPDSVGVAVLAIASLAAGLVMNGLSSWPLPVVYKTSERQFDMELTFLNVGRRNARDARRAMRDRAALF
jgi:hypothetical protein